MCPKRLSFRNTGECSQMFDEISLYIYFPYIQAKLFQFIKIDFIMPKFTNFEMADMHFAYGLANGNSRKVRRIYVERYPQCNLPCRTTFANIHRYSRKGFFCKEYC